MAKEAARLEMPRFASARFFRFCLAASRARSNASIDLDISKLISSSRGGESREGALSRLCSLPDDGSISRSRLARSRDYRPDIKAAAVYLLQRKTCLYFPRHAATRPHINSRHGASQVAQKMNTTDSRNNNGRKLMMAGINGQRVATGDVPA